MNNKPTWWHYISRIDTLDSIQYEFKNRKVYFAYREYVRGQVFESDYMSSITGRAMRKGFVPNRELNPIDNWFGVSKYSPDAILTRGNKVIKLSLQGPLMPLPRDEETMKLADAIACKYISFEEDNKILYESFCGNLPTKDFENEFLTK